MSLVAELKRRKVLKVGAAYLVAAWLAIQVVSIAFPAFEAPAWALRAFILLAMLGFPVVLAVAWAFQSTPEGLRRDTSTAGNKRMAAVVAVFVLLALGWYLYGMPALRPGQEVASAPPTFAFPSSDISVSAKATSALTTG